MKLTVNCDNGMQKESSGSIKLYIMMHLGSSYVITASVISLVFTARVGRISQCLDTMSCLLTSHCSLAQIAFATSDLPYIHCVADKRFKVIVKVLL